MKKIDEYKVEMFLDEDMGGVYVFFVNGVEDYRQDCSTPVSEREKDAKEYWDYLLGYGD